MGNIHRNVLTAGAFALCTVAGLTQVKAEVLRIVVVVADNATIMPPTWRCSRPSRSF